MKHRMKIRQIGGALAALVASLGMSSSANALTFTWLEGPQIGQTFTGGGIQVKAINYDTGTLYNELTVGTGLGFGANGASANVAAGITDLNAAAAIDRGALGAVAGQNDSWGILRITSIQATDSGGVLRDIYNSAVNNYELTAMFWGVEDFYLEQVAPPGTIAAEGQVIDGIGLRVDIYSDLAKNFDQTPGPTGPHTVNTYPTVTDGTLELSLLSTPGFINADGTFGGVATEFESNTAATGYAALNVTGGASAAQFDTNAIGFGGSSGAAFSPGLAGQTATDIWFSFTSTQGVNDWDITSNDPMLANISGIPDSGSTLLMFGLGLGLLAAGYRRRSRKS